MDEYLYTLPQRSDEVKDYLHLDPWLVAAAYGLVYVSLAANHQSSAIGPAEADFIGGRAVSVDHRVSCARLAMRPRAFAVADPAGVTERIAEVELLRKNGGLFLAAAWEPWKKYQAAAGVYLAPVEFRTRVQRVVIFSSGQHYEPDALDYANAKPGTRWSNGFPPFDHPDKLAAHSIALAAFAWPFGRRVAVKEDVLGWPYDTEKFFHFEPFVGAARWAAGFNADGAAKAFAAGFWPFPKIERTTK